MFDVALSSAGVTIASFDENHPPENIIDGKVFYVQRRSWKSF